MSRILAVDANQYVVRLALVDPDGYLAAAVDAKPNNYDKMLMFVRSQAIQNCHRISVTGSPVDRWPTELHHIVEDKVGVRVDWVSPDFLRRTGPELALWQHRRKFDRARLLGLASSSRTLQAADPEGLVRQWQRLLIDEASQRLLDMTPR
ncbi:MAG TPA: hypothetical protein VGO93_00355 [Candidatus Xenobia bacterium]|jgi:hypothetical protein